MTIRGVLRAGVATMVAAGVAFGTSGVARVGAADYTRYHNYEELTAALRELAKTHANLARLVEVAKTREGRSVWAIEIGNPAGTPLAERPALLIAANLEGDQVIGSELALFVAEALLTGYATNSGDQAAARCPRVLHPAARQSRRGRADVRAAQDRPQDEHLEIRQRQRRPGRRRWPARI